MWHLLRNNLKGRKAFNAVIVCAAALAFMVALTSSLLARDMEKELEHKQRLLGPELALVPPGTKERGHIYLTKGPPGHGRISAGTASAARQFPEVEAVCAQKLLGSERIGKNTVMLIAFDPATDFMVLPWWAQTAGASLKLSDGEVIVGSEVAPETRIGATLEAGGKSYRVAGRLSDAGSFMNTAIFFPTTESAFGGEVSWVLISLQQGISVDMMINKLETNIGDIEVIARPEMLKTINDQLAGVARGGGLNAAAMLVVSGALLVTGAMFALLVYERRREFGLLKAMGAKNSFVFKLIVGEAVILACMGAALGLIFSLIRLLAGGTPLLPGDLPLLSGLSFVAVKVATTSLLIVGVGAVTALFPALLTARLEPYAAVRKGE